MRRIVRALGIAVLLAMTAGGPWLKAARADAPPLRKAVLVVPFQSRLMSPDEACVGVVAAHVLDHLLSLHNGLEECWAYWYTRLLFPSQTDFDAWLGARSKTPLPLEAVACRYVVSGTVVEENAKLIVRLDLLDRASGKSISKALLLDFPRLEAFRTSFLQMLAEAGIPAPPEQRAAMLWKESLSRKASGHAGRGLEAFYWNLGDEHRTFDARPFEAALQDSPDSYVLADDLGFALLGQRQIAAARQAFRRALAANPAGADAANGMLNCAIAEQVIDLLKDDEYRRGTRGSGGPQKTATLSPREEGWRKRYDEVVGRLGALGADYDALEGKRPLTDEDKKRLVVLQGDLQVAQQAYRAFLADVSREADVEAGASARIAQLKSNGDLRSALAELGEHCVILYTLVGPDACRVILITPSFQEVFSSPIPREKLHHEILDFRRALTNPAIDPRPEGRKLYDLLVGRATESSGRITLAERLRQYGARTLMWELDGSLRYIPVAALYDGQHYLAESYESVVYTPASNLSLLKDVPDPQKWKALGLGVSEARENFSALPSVVGELHGVVQDSRSPGGALPGTVLLDDAFTSEAMRQNLLDRYGVVYIASHFSLNAGNVEDSFLLIGRGAPPHLTLADLASWGPSPFRGVDLLTLSACNTGVGSRGADGKEVETFAVVAQNQGARAVLATLWEVDDPSTKVFMETFYRILRTQRVTKAAALQMAEQALLRGQGSKPTGEGTRGNAPVSSAASTARFPRDVRTPWAHPYYWAPFVLMGNWK